MHLCYYTCVLTRKTKNIRKVLKMKIPYQFRCLLEIHLDLRLRTAFNERLEGQELRLKFRVHVGLKSVS